jgi:hypothetical protein
MTERLHLQDARGNSPRDGHKRTGAELAAEHARGNRVLAVNPAPPGLPSKPAQEPGRLPARSRSLP